MKNKIYKLLSIIVALAVVLSCCVIGFTASAADEVKATYYLDGSSANSGDDTAAGTEAAPLKTLNGAINKAIADAEAGGYNTADYIVDFKIISADICVPFHDGTTTASQAFNFKLRISPAGSYTSFLGNSGESFTIKGDVEISKVYFDFSRRTFDAYFGFGGNVKLNSDVILGKNSANLYDYNLGALLLGTQEGVESTTFSKDQTFELNNNMIFGGLYLGSLKGATYNGDLNFNYNFNTGASRNCGRTQSIYFGGITAGYDTVYNGDLKFNITDTNGINFKKSAGNVSFGETASVQIINTSGKTVSITEAKSVLPEATYVFTNNTGIADLIAFTDKAGEYAVDTSKYDVTATAADGTTYNAKDNLLKVPAGEYELSYSVPAKTLTYYVSAGATGTPDGSEKAPYATIGEAVNAAVVAAEAGNFNYPNSTVYLKVLGTTAVDCADIDPTCYNFTLNISSASETGDAVLELLSDDSYRNYTGFTTIFNGPTVLSNITLKAKTWAEIYLNGDNFTVEDSATINYVSSSAYFTASNDKTSITKTQNIVFKSDGTVAPTYFTVGGNYSTTYDADLNLTYNAPSISQGILMDSANKNRTNTFNKNLNMNFVAAAGITLKLRDPATSGKVVFGSEAALQIINSTGNSVDYSAIESSLPAKTYVITNKTGIKDLIAFTETAGTYTVDTKKYDVTATAEDGTEIPAANGKLVLDPGKYTLSVELAPITADYYVNAAAADGGNGTKAAPFKTVGEALTYAIAHANANTYNASNSTVNIYLLGDSRIDIQGMSNQAFNFQLNIATDASLATPCTVYTGPAAFHFGGPTNLDNVIFDISSASAKEIYVNGNNLKMGENVQITGLGAGTYFTVGGTTVEEAQTVYFTNKSTSTRSFQFYTLGGGSNNTYKDDITFVYDAPNYSQTILIDSISRNKVNTVNKNMNLNFVASAGIKLDLRAALTSGAMATDTGKIVFTDGAAFQMINSTGNTVDYSAIASMLPANKYIITNNTGVKDIINFTETAGTFTVKNGYNVTAVAADKTTYDSKDGKLVIETTGEFKLITAAEHDAQTNNYSEYIVDRGNGLTNTYAKLAAKEDINVAYFGGSVTGGTGVSDPDADSWRAKVGKWLENNFPVSNIENINMAVGGTGTKFGVYRTEAQLIAADPDLVFIDFAVNDLYDGASAESASMRLETIIRKLRTAKPDCDIVVLLVSNDTTFDTDIAGGLHAIAKAHENIAIAYDIPSIHLGNALADAVADKANWSNYYDDSVHPNATGYELCYQIIKEYLNNELVYGSGTAANHTMPAQVNKELLDGEFTVIKADQAFIDASGSAFGFNSAICQYGANNKYNPFVGAAENIAVLSNGEEYAHPDGKTGAGKFVFEFTGTELSILSMGQHVTGYSVKIDDGEAYTVDLSGTVPTLLASDLESATHTAEVSPIYEEWTESCNHSHVDWVYAFLVYDAGEEGYDVNGDGVYNICDLVYTAELEGKTSADADYNGVADKDNDGDIDADDTAIVRNELLTGKLYGTDIEYDKIVKPVDATDET